MDGVNRREVLAIGLAMMLAGAHARTSESDAVSARWKGGNEYDVWVERDGEWVFRGTYKLDATHSCGAAGPSGDVA